MPSPDALNSAVRSNSYATLSGNVDLNAAHGGTEDKLISAQRVIRKLYRKSIEVSSNLTQIVCRESAFFVVFNNVFFSLALTPCCPVTVAYSSMVVRSDN